MTAATDALLIAEARKNNPPEKYLNGSLLNALADRLEQRNAELARNVAHMVNRFLSWRLPEAFHPDGGISFKPFFNEYNEHLPQPLKAEPTGTNLFDATQAEQMVRHMIEGLPSEEVV